MFFAQLETHQYKTIHNSIVLLGEKDSKYIDILSTFLGISPPLMILNTTLVESPQEKISSNSLPASLDSTPVKLIASPLCA